METRVCKKCNNEKDINSFTIRNGVNGVLRKWSCKSCLLEYAKTWRINSPEKANLYYKNNKDAIQARVLLKIQNDTESYRKNRQEINRRYRKNKCKTSLVPREKNIKAIKIKIKKTKKTKLEILEARRKRYPETRERHNFLKKENYRKLDKSKKSEIAKKSVAYILKRRSTDPLFKMTCNLRKRTWAALKAKSYKKQGTTENLLGAPFIIIKKHIEKKFKKGMSWDNYGIKTWHIDHKIPLSSAKTEAELIVLCHYTNLQPLWAKENLEKNNTINPTQMTMPI